MNTIEIGIAKMTVAKSPDILVARSLGSCVGIALYDPVAKIGAMAHVMLPDSTLTKRKNYNPAKFADTAVPAMIDKMIKTGTVRNRTVAKIVGGAKMFTSVGNNSSMNIGSRTVDAAKNALKKNDIKLVAEDVKKNYGRTVEFNLEKGIIKIKSLGKGVKTI